MHNKTVAVLYNMYIPLIVKSKKRKMVFFSSVILELVYRIHSTRLWLLTMCSASLMGRWCPKYMCRILSLILYLPT